MKKTVCAFFAITLVLLTAFSPAENWQTPSLDGTWVPVKQEMGGKPFPIAVYEKMKMIIQDSTYTVIAESVDKGIVRSKDGKLDIYGKEGVNAGKHFTALYKLENGTLTICYNLAGTEYPASFSTDGKPLYFLSVFRKE
jgi:uncharacterized protein (TIGR03067 family)